MYAYVYVATYVLSFTSVRRISFIHYIILCLLWPCVVVFSTCTVLNRPMQPKPWKVKFK